MVCCRKDLIAVDIIFVTDNCNMSLIMSMWRPQNVSDRKQKDP